MTTALTSLGLGMAGTGIPGLSAVALLAPQTVHMQTQIRSLIAPTETTAVVGLPDGVVASVTLPGDPDGSDAPDGPGDSDGSPLPPSNAAAGAGVLGVLTSGAQWLWSLAKTVVGLFAAAVRYILPAAAELSKAAVSVMVFLVALGAWFLHEAIVQFARLKHLQVDQSRDGEFFRVENPQHQVHHNENQSKHTATHQ
jgi:hypothetical protein